VLALLFLDLFVLHRNAREVPLGEAMWLSGFWIAISLASGGFVWFLAGPDGAVAYWTAYLIEKSLSGQRLRV
jgi:tellurite resistance protein TerC